jgi:cyclohexanone monooxygenase
MDSADKDPGRPATAGESIPNPADVVGHINAEELAGTRARYAAERGRRLRPDGTAQFQFLEGDLATFDTDHHAPQIAERAPCHDEVDVLIIGAGLGGIQAAVWLQNAGVTDIRLVDRAADFGGTWYWNRYPGLRCDTESYIYLPLLEETGFMPAERYTRGSEILEYCSHLGRHFGLYAKSLFQTLVTGLEWDEVARRWVVTTDRADVIRARFVTTQSGIFNRPQLPGIPGITDFAGHAFHTARWDYRYTGGGPEGGLTGLSDKRVAIFGTGTTALQVVPEVAQHARQLTVFQRTPAAVNYRNNAPTDAEWFGNLEPGWQQARIEAFNNICSGLHVPDAPVDDGWTRFFDYLYDATQRIPEELRTLEALDQATEAADYEWNAMLRARVDETVLDPAKADRLKAYYRTLCKRLGFSDNFLSVFNLDNVDIVDVLSASDLRFTPEGVCVDGQVREFDCVIFATGFEIGTTWVHQARYDPVGRGGVRLSEAWGEGLRTFQGFHAAGFPNLIFLGMTQTATTLNVSHMLQQQVRHVSALLAECLREGIEVIEATPEAVNSWQEVIAGKNAQRAAFIKACTPSYLNNEGKGAEDKRAALASGVYFPSFEFWEMLDKWRAVGDYQGLTIITADGNRA